MNVKIDMAKGGSWAYIFWKVRGFHWTKKLEGQQRFSLSKKLEGQQRGLCDKRHVHLINLTSIRC